MCGIPLLIQPEERIFPQVHIFEIGDQEWGGLLGDGDERAGCVRSGRVGGRQHHREAPAGEVGVADRRTARRRQGLRSAGRRSRRRRGCSRPPGTPRLGAARASGRIGIGTAFSEQGVARIEDSNREVFRSRCST
jgi:hypothetical protein